MDQTDFSNFTSLDIRVGTVVRAEVFEKARNPAYKLWINFGEEIGELKSSAQITENYPLETLVETQVLAIVNFESKQIADFMSECLVLGVYGIHGVVLLRPDKPCTNGQKVG